MKRMGFYVNCLSAEIHTDPFFHGAGGFGELLQYAVLFVCVCMCLCSVSVYQCLLIWSPEPDLREDGHKYIPVHTLVIRALSYWNISYIEYDVEALIMDVSSSWKGGKALIHTHRFPGIFIGLAKCHYTAGGEVMNCNKL